MGAARSVLEKSTMMLLTTSKVQYVFFYITQFEASHCVRGTGVAGNGVISDENVDHGQYRT